MQKVVLYSKEGCHLCEQALTKLQHLRVEHEFQLDIIEITNDKALFERYFLSIPVVELDGNIVFQASDMGSSQDFGKLETLFCQTLS